MRFNEFSQQKLTMPEQARIKCLQTQKDSAGKALKAERDRQKMAKARQAINPVNQPILPKP